MVTNLIKYSRFTLFLLLKLLIAEPCMIPWSPFLSFTTFVFFLKWGMFFPLVDRSSVHLSLISLSFSQLLKLCLAVFSCTGYSFSAILKRSHLGCLDWSLCSRFAADVLESGIHLHHRPGSCLLCYVSHFHMLCHSHAWSIALFCWNTSSTYKGVMFLETLHF